MFESSGTPESLGLCKVVIVWSMNCFTPQSGSAHRPVYELRLPVDGDSPLARDCEQRLLLRRDGYTDPKLVDSEGFHIRNLSHAEIGIMVMSVSKVLGWAAEVARPVKRSVGPAYYSQLKHAILVKRPGARASFNYPANPPLNPTLFYQFPEPRCWKR